MRYWGLQLNAKELANLRDSSFSLEEFKTTLILRINKLRPQLDTMASANMDIVISFIKRANTIEEFEMALDWLYDTCNAYGIFVITK